ncbi:unnamed protein product [Allacma fusca]|uniref:CRAL-TRIO domain-containing protein n=1 Tax=Allacma fusca TaxID=39272 RepID=A0A8J2M5R3_9HEXA|nr:unnamed protein product [Allacma fusca]
MAITRTIIVWDMDIIKEDPLYEEDFYLLRWLKAYNMSVRKAEKHLRSTANWRKENDVASLYDANFPMAWLESMPIYADAVTKDGSIACSIQAGLVDIRGMLEELGRQDFVKYLTQAFVQVERVLIELNKYKNRGQPLTENCIDGGTILLDMDQFAPRQLRSFEVLSTIGEVCKNVVKHFPYLGATFIVLNCNTVSAVLLKVIRSILESPSFKFEVYGQDRAEWEESIQNQIPAHMLRDVFGGTRPKEEKMKRDILIDRDLILSLAEEL